MTHVRPFDKFRPRSFLLALTLAAVAMPAVAATPAGPIAGEVVEEIIVTGDLRESSLQRAATSVTVIDDLVLRERSATHLEDVLNVAPNVNFSSGASRGRFFQIRGIGERGQFAEPLNPSVGVIMDDVDLSGAATAATLFDMQQVEVFRGPQSSRYGANAHAGLIVLRSAAPTVAPEAYAELEAGDYGRQRVGAVLSGPLAGETLTGRVALQRYEADGYTDNSFLGRDDTEARDELTLRTRLRWLVSEKLTADLSLSRIEIDNGYDAFSFESGRTTRSDQPGHDEQATSLGSLKLTLATLQGFTVEAIGALSDSNIDYGYDEDWSFVGFHPDEYSSFDRYLRDRRTRTLEVRFRSDADGRLFGDSTDWLVGLYDHRREVDLTRLYTFAPGPFDSAYETGRQALFGQIGVDLAPRWRVVTGLRVERRDARYDDSAGVRFDPDETLWGGRVGVEWSAADDTLLYGSVSRGYKAGGFNTDGSLDADLREYDSESVINYELGAKGRFDAGRGSARLALFWMDRQDQQVSTSLVRVRGDGSAEFIDFVGNAAEGTNYGMEAEIDWQATERFGLSASLGLLNTELEDFVNSAGQDLSGRDQAHAPQYQFHVAADWRWPSGWFARLETEGRDQFYWSDSHAEQSRAYALVNGRLGWQGEHLEVALWSRNLGDEDYGVRGFGGFGNDPRNGYASEEYVQLGAPRTFGVSTRLSL
ncbi:MAG TPA: TonB-dependent receptor [Pseudomonadales bacterium]|nr:TonB-dependent receptor [Pseudomonadales bacterium]